MGYERLGAPFRQESIDEMKDADALMERILYLDGVPNLQRLGSVRVGETPVEKLQLALELEREAIDRLNGGAALCIAKGDNGSRELCARILVGEEEHADWLESQLELRPPARRQPLPRPADPELRSRSTSASRFLLST